MEEMTFPSFRSFFASFEKGEIWVQNFSPEKAHEAHSTSARLTASHGMA